jgi:hypothetical protein
MSAHLVLRKGVGALIPDAKPTGAFSGLLAVQTWGLWLLELRLLRRLSGGLWVGGDLEVWTDHLSFTPNAINRAVHEGDLDRRISLQSITNVAWRHGS